MRVRVDRDRCQGHGRCYSLAPELFEPDEVGDAWSATGRGPAGRSGPAGRPQLPRAGVVIEEDA